jgi:hypothetical protein
MKRKILFRVIYTLWKNTDKPLKTADKLLNFADNRIKNADRLPIFADRHQKFTDSPLRSNDYGNLETLFHKERASIYKKWHTNS